MTSRVHRLLPKNRQRSLVFLPDSWMKLVKPEKFEKIPPNMAKFVISNEMGAQQVGEYLKKIYKLPVRQVLVRVEQGKMIRALDKYKEADRVAGIYGRILDKEPDRTIAFVTFDRQVNFQYPQLFADKIFEQEQKQMERLEENRQHQLASADFKRHFVPSWFK